MYLSFGFFTKFYSHHNEEANTVKSTVKPRCIKLTTIMSGPISLGRGHHGPKSLDTQGNLPQQVFNASKVFTSPQGDMFNITILR